MAPCDHQTLEAATTAVTTDAQPDSKTRRYDRQLRLWAATGQNALESSRILVIGGSATSTSILKNLVLPGIGHFTILDDQKVTPEDAGNNFFLEGHDSIGKSRAEEAVRLLLELNDGVEGKANTSSLADILENNPSYITSFTLVIAHNLEPTLLAKLSSLLWSDATYPPLIALRSAGFLGDFTIQFHEHTIVESHSETAPSLRIDKPFPALLEHAVTLDLEGMDSTDHSHVPYAVILVRALDIWKKSHDGNPPLTYPEKQEFKKGILAMKHKSDEENFDEAEAQAYRCWTETKVPSEIAALFQDPGLSSLGPESAPFFHLLSALHQYTLQPPHTLPLSPALPDMKADTKSYIALQKLYKTRAEEEKTVFRGLVGIPVEQSVVDTFVKNAHGLQVLRGKPVSSFDADSAALANALSVTSKETSTHLALSALSILSAKQPGVAPTSEALVAEIKALLPAGTELPDSMDDAVGEIVRSPTADLPNTAGFLGGLVAQEAIKMITKQYVPVKSYCVVDLVETWTAVIG